MGAIEADLVILLNYKIYSLVVNGFPQVGVDRGIVFNLLNLKFVLIFLLNPGSNIPDNVVM